MRLDQLFHVSVLFTYLESDRVFVFCVEIVDAFAHERDLLFEESGIMVSDNITRLGFRRSAGQLRHVEESVIAVSIFRPLFLRQHSFKLGCYPYRIDQNILCGPGMYVATLKIYACFSSVEIFILQLSENASVNGVSVIHTESFYVEIVCAAADFFVGGERDPYSAMRDRRIVYERFSHGHDLGNAGFIVASEK